MLLHAPTPDARRPGTALYKSDCSQQVETAIKAGFTHLGGYICSTSASPLLS